MTIEEEAPTTAGSCACLEDHVSVELRAETCVEHAEVQVELREGVCESLHAVEGYLDVFLHYDWIADIVLAVPTPARLMGGAPTHTLVDCPLIWLLNLDALQMDRLVSLALLLVLWQEHHGALLLHVNRLSPLLIRVEVGEPCDALQDDEDKLNIQAVSQSVIEWFQLLFLTLLFGEAFPPVD